MPGIGQPPQASATSGVTRRMREMQAHPQRVVASQHLLSVGVTRMAARPLACYDPDELEVRIARSARQHVFEPVFVERQRVAAGDQAVGTVGVAAM